MQNYCRLFGQSSGFDLYCKAFVDARASPSKVATQSRLELISVNLILGYLRAKHYVSALIIEYSYCVTAAVRVFEAFVRQDIAMDRQRRIHTCEHTKPSISDGDRHNKLGNRYLKFEDPDVTILNSPGLFVFEACTSVLEIFCALIDQYPWAANKLQETVANSLVVAGVIDTYPARLKAVMDRTESLGTGELNAGTTQLRATAKEFCPAASKYILMSGRSLFHLPSMFRLLCLEVTLVLDRQPFMLMTSRQYMERVSLSLRS